MNNNTSLWIQVEKEIADLLIDELEHTQITPERAAQVARFVVKSIPEKMTDRQILEIIPHLDDEFSELAIIVQKHMEEYEKKNEPIVQHKVEDLLKIGHFKEASELMQKYFENKI